MAKRKFTMTDEHKKALSAGRQQSKTVRDYLESLEQSSRPGRKLSGRELQKRIDDMDKKIADADNPATRLELVQQRLDYEKRLAATGDGADHDQLEKDFAKVANDYSDRKGISYTAWREIGVPAAVLKQAGIARTRR